MPRGTETWASEAWMLLADLREVWGPEAEGPGAGVLQDDGV